MCRAGPRCRGGKYRGPASPGQPYRTPSQPGSPVLNVLRQMLRCVRAQYRPRIQSRLHRGQDSDSGMLWQRGRDPGRRVHHQAIVLSAAVDLEDGAAHINPSGPSRGGPSTSPQPSITAGRRAVITEAACRWQRGECGFGSPCGGLGRAATAEIYSDGSPYGPRPRPSRSEHGSDLVNWRTWRDSNPRPAA